MPTLLRVYAECLVKTGKAVFRAPWTLLLPMLYGAAAAVIGVLMAPLGIVGSFVMGFVQAALFASLLYFLDELVGGNPVKPRELVLSLKRYLWPVINVLFIFWIAQMIVGPMLENRDNGPVLQLALMIGLFVLLNATPETIYQKRLYGGLDTLAASVRFIQTNWLEWFLPNLALGAAAWFGVPWLLSRIPLGVLLALGTVGTSLVIGLVSGAVLLPVMVFRGHLYHLLDTTSARQRQYRYRKQ